MTSRLWRAVIAEAEIAVRRIWRARMLLVKIPEVPTHFKLVASPNSKLFMAAVRRANRHKTASIGDLSWMLEEMGWDPDAPELVEAPLKRWARKRSAKDCEASALERYERRALSRRKFAVRDFDAARLDAAKKRSLAEG